MKIGIIPSSNDFSHPADRRRSINYFKKRDNDYEIALFGKYYDYLYVTIAADLSLWSSYKNKWNNLNVKPYVIFDFCDDLLSASIINDFIRGLYYYISGKTIKYNISYKRTIIKMITSSDVIICGSVEQKLKLDKLHNNVVIIRDYFGEDIKLKKEDYKLIRKDEIHILWEGLSNGNIKIFKYLNQIISTIDTFKVNIHIVTDPIYCRYGGKTFCQPTVKILKSVFSSSFATIHYHEWQASTLCSVASKCDLALIPVPSDKIMKMKPENKLLLLWELGLPVVATDTQAYRRVMENANIEYIITEFSQWREKILYLVNSHDERISYINKAKTYIKENCSENVILSAWDSIFRIKT